MAAWNEMGQRLQRLRGAKTQQEVAEALRVKRETIAQWENETRRIKDVDIIKLANYYGCTCDYILRGVEAENVDIHKETGLSENAIRILKAMTADALASKCNKLDDLDLFDSSIATLIFINRTIEQGLLTGIAESLLEASGDIVMREARIKNLTLTYESGSFPAMIDALEKTGCVVLTPTRLNHYYRAEAQMHYDELSRFFSEDRQFYAEYSDMRDQIEGLLFANRKMEVDTNAAQSKD